MSQRTANLTEREKQILRHVHALKTSTEIAHDLSIAEVSVNKRIDSARRKLGGISRRQAALLLAEEEHGEGYQNLIPPEIILTRTAPELHKAWIDVREDKVGQQSSIPLITIREGRRNLLDLWQRIGVIIFSMAALAAIASVYIALLRRH